MSETRKILSLAWPLMIGQLSQMLMGVADTMMVGKLGTTEQAALGLANSIFHMPLVFGIGLLTCVAIRSSAARGANDAAAARQVCRHGLYLSLACGAILFLLAYFSLPGLGYLGQDPVVVARAPGYFLLIMGSLIPCLAGIALKNHADALDRPWPVFWITMAGVFLNIGLNALLIFGHWGFPQMGLEGAGVATLLARLAIFVGILWWLRWDKSLRDWVPHQWLRAPMGKEMRSLLSMGLPSSLHTLAEVSAFSIAGVVVGQFGQQALASHQIALTCAGVAFMLPLGMSQALTVRMGEVFGEGRSPRLKALALSGWALVLGLTMSNALIFILFGERIAASFSEDAVVVAMTVKLLGVAAAFQLVDGLQVASGGMLRGLQQVKAPAVGSVLGYWGLAIPLGYGLAHGANWGPLGVWWGLAVGLGAVAAYLSWLVWLRAKSRD